MINNTYITLERFFSFLFLFDQTKILQTFDGKEGQEITIQTGRVHVHNLHTSKFCIVDHRWDGYMESNAGRKKICSIPFLCDEKESFSKKSLTSYAHDVYKFDW